MQWTSPYIKTDEDRLWINEGLRFGYQLRPPAARFWRLPVIRHCRAFYRMWQCHVWESALGKVRYHPRYARRGVADLCNLEGLAVIKIGDTLYRHEPYGRQGDPKWIAVKVVGETKQSWLYAPFGEGTETRVKVSKKTMMTARDYRGINDKYFTEEGRDAKDFCDKWARLVGHLVEQVRNPEELRQIAAIVGKVLT